MGSMNSSKSGSGPGDDAKGSWATESVPMAVRKDLLARELKKLAARHGTAERGGNSHESQQQGQTGHPSADAPAQDERAG